MTNDNCPMTQKYAQAPDALDEAIRKRKDRGLLSAFGYASNLDLLCAFRQDVLNHFLTEALAGSDPDDARPQGRIENRRDLAETILYYCRNGLGGEADLADSEALLQIVDAENAIGGTGVQASLALSAVGGECLSHLTDRSEEVLSILSAPGIHVVGAEGVLCNPKDLAPENPPEPHCIVQYRAGQKIRVGGRVFEVPVSNRLILTDFTINGCLPLDHGTLQWIEGNASRVPSLLLSGFNCITELSVLQERIRAVSEHAAHYHRNHPSGIVYYENGDYHREVFLETVLRELLPSIDIVGMNEEELEKTLRMVGEFPDLSDILSVVRGAELLISRFGIKKGMVVHTKDYSMYVGEPLPADIESGLMYGNMMAAAKALHGFFGTPREVRETLNLPLSKTGCAFLRILSDTALRGRAILVPTRYIEAPAHTIGLGDAFTAGVHLCF